MIFLNLCRFLPKIFLLGALVSFHPFPATADNTDDKYSSEKSKLTNAYSAIHLDKTLQKTSGLQTLILKPATYQTEFPAFGSAVDISPLLESRRLYFAALADFEIANIHLVQEQQALTRVRNLHSEKAASTRKLHTQKTKRDIALAEQTKSRNDHQALQELTVLKWGKKLTAWAFAPDSVEFSRFISKDRVLILITLPPGQTLPTNLKTIHFTQPDSRSRIHTAELISPAPYADPILQGETFFFATQSKLRTGVHITAGIPQFNDGLIGVVIPASSVTRHLGQNIVYIESGKDTFTPRVISKLVPVSEGYFIQSEISPGEKLVTTGAQMLLSEDFRNQIPEEDDDDD